MVGTQRSRVCWVHRGARYRGYTEEQATVGTQRSRVWWVHRGAGYGGYTEEQGMVGTQRNRVWLFAAHSMLDNKTYTAKY